MLIFLCQGIAVNGTTNITLPINCQLAITEDWSGKYSVGNTSQLGRAQFKSVFGEK